VVGKKRERENFNLDQLYKVNIAYLCFSITFLIQVTLNQASDCDMGILGVCRKIRKNNILFLKLRNRLK